MGALLVVDLAAYFVGSTVAARLVNEPGLGIQISLNYWLLILLSGPVLALILAWQGLYDSHYLLGGPREYAAVLRACTFSLVALVLMSFATHLAISRQWAALSWLFSVIFIGTLRFALRRVAYGLRHRGLFTSRALLVGADAQGLATARRLMQPPSGIHLVGVLDDYLPAGTLVAGKLKVLGTSARLPEAAARMAARDIIVAPQALPWESLHSLLTTAATTSDGPRLHLLGGLYDLLATGVRFSQPNGVPMLTIKKVALSAKEAALKRALDLSLAMSLLVVFSPIIALELVHLVLKRAPMIERRRVGGRDGQPFDLLTLPSGVLTRSALVRKLPSLLNVLAGQLSIVGPHPVPLTTGGAPERSRRQLFGLRPGLTGLWRQAEDPEEQVVLDMYYIRGYSIWLDLHILFDRFKARFHASSERIGTSDALPARLV